MTREERKRKIWQAISKEYGYMCVESCIDRIVDALDEPEPPKFREHEIVWNLQTGELTKAGLVADKAHCEKIATKELAHTVAPPDAVRWELRNNHSILFFDEYRNYCRNSDGTIYVAYCPHDGEAEGTL